MNPISKHPITIGEATEYVLGMLTMLSIGTLVPDPSALSGSQPLLISITLENLASVLGLSGGFAAICIAWYLQKGMNSHVPARFVAFFMVLGSALILGNISGLYDSVPFADVWPVVANGAIILTEVWLFYHLREKYDVEVLTPVLERAK